jgi:hypothetical protein
MQFHAMVMSFEVGCRVSGGSKGKESGCCIQRGEDARRRQVPGKVARKGDFGIPVRTDDTKRNGRVGILSLEATPLKQAGKDTPAQSLVEPRIGITPGNKYAFLQFPVLIPLDSDAMGGIF